MFKKIVIAAALMVAVAGSASAHREGKNAKITPVFDHVIPNLPGKGMRGLLGECGPGGYSPSHTHAKSSFIYATVVEGEIRSQKNGGEERVFKVGENFIENAGDHHGSSANGSDTKPAKLIAVFVVDTETELAIRNK
ncbi:quercetin dioxygenase-like cupin family protein [Rhizobium sp. BIGb0125]|uniref:cupin domain-containing protein n=1 Tax=Rhizobium sp. BIGb0125 TaxID=2940618 RepID=UPI00216A37E0|nr:cupin domain-containing protein [Rhizobium sp. BIGb0125]MCS4243103.1 quercetin dioxygenase-like cupin family protein [Rhizobium sp. BIGb0125]